MNTAKMYIFRFYKILNWGKLAFSYLLYRFTSLQIIQFYPATIAIEPLNMCNLSCPECPSGNKSMTRARKSMTMELFRDIVHEIKPHTFTTTLYFQGEPYLHPLFTEMIALCHTNGIYTYTSTNAQLITYEIAKKTVEAGLDKIVVSADGLTQDIYAMYRHGGDLQKVKEAIQNLSYWKKQLNSKSPIIEFQFIVMKHNEFQSDAVRKTALAWGADTISMKSAQIDFERIESLIPHNQKFARYSKDQDGIWKRKKSLKNHCWKQWNGAVITADGDVLPCCFDKNGEHAFGNIKTETLHDIWNGTKAKQFRAMLRSNRQEIAICRNCSE